MEVCCIILVNLPKSVVINKYPSMYVNSYLWLDIFFHFHCFSKAHMQTKKPLPLRTCAVIRNETVYRQKNTSLAFKWCTLKSRSHAERLACLFVWMPLKEHFLSPSPNVTIAKRPTGPIPSNKPIKYANRLSFFPLTPFLNTLLTRLWHA